jgi:glycosyltransferase involved in cell wall biosynthesis
MRVSVLIPCLNRHKLVERSLYTLSRQTHPVDVFVIDDGSRPGLEKIAEDAGAIYERIRDPILPDAQDVGGAAQPWRHVYYATDHDFVILTHPEILVPFDAVERMVEQHVSPRRSTPLLYFINKPLLEKIENYPWRKDVHSIQKAPGFMGIWNRWGLYNRHMRQWKHHVCFTGQTREDWDAHNFLPAIDEIGAADDAWLWGIEDALSKKTGISHYVNQIDLTVYHQFHKVSDWSTAGDDLWQSQNYGHDPLRSPRIARIHQASAER